MRKLRRLSGPVRGPAQPHCSLNRTWAEAHTQPILSAISNSHSDTASIASHAGS